MGFGEFCFVVFVVWVGLVLLRCGLGVSDGTRSEWTGTFGYMV